MDQNDAKYGEQIPRELYDIAALLMGFIAELDESTARDAWRSERHE